MGLEFSDIHHSYGEKEVLKGTSFEASRGCITCLVGASGSGKTTLLRLAAGMLELQSGEIRLDGDQLANAHFSPPPEARGIGLVFQEGALFPHLTVAQNIGFGLKDRRTRGSRVAELLDLVGLTAYAGQRPHRLSGGQQQRVALARALAPAPRVLLLDEPFASLDARLRRELRREVRDILTASDVISVLVTHDPEEAMEMGDRIVYLEDGDIVQYGAPETFFEAPRTPEIARIFCTANIVEGTIAATGVSSELGDWPLDCLDNPAAGPGAACLAIRPEDLLLTAGDEDGVAASIVMDRRRIGAAWQIAGTSRNGERWIAHMRNSSVPMRGDRVHLHPRPGSVLTYSKPNGNGVPFP